MASLVHRESAITGAIILSRPSSPVVSVAITPTTPVGSEVRTVRGVHTAEYRLVLVEPIVLVNPAIDRFGHLGLGLLL